MDKSILIIAFKFPPMGGIGTRRWAKFSKYFAQKGYKVHILTINYTDIDKVNWLSDIEDNENIIVHRVKSGYPQALMNLSSNRYISFFQKTINFLLKKSFFYIDIAQNWGRYMIPKAKEIIDTYSIENVIVTNPPPSVSYFATYLKIELPHINLIQDFRDSWNDDIDYSYPKTLKFFWQKEKSAYMEWFVVNYSDHIVNVTDDITQRTKNKFKAYEDKFLTIYNGFDKDDIKGLKRKSINSDKIKIIYAGGLGLGRMDAIISILDTLLTFEDITQKKFEINIYTSFNSNVLDKKYKALLDNIVFFHALVSSDKILLEIDQHEYCLSINAPMYPYAFGTKIFDYMMLDKKIIHISEGGELYRLLQEQNQYVCSYGEGETITLFRLLLNEKEKEISKRVLDYEKFNIEKLVVDYEQLLV